MARFNVLNLLSVLAILPVGCVPPGKADKKAPASDTPALAKPAPQAVPFKPSVDVMTKPFEDTFERGAAPIASSKPAAASPATAAKASNDAAPFAQTSAVSDSGLGADWEQAGTDVWHIEGGMLCGSNAHNHGVWLKRTLPINARIEFDAMSTSPDGDLKAEVWGDGRSSAHSVSYVDATSYLTIFGGWKNSLNVLARINEHGRDRQETQLVPGSVDPRTKQVVPGQKYHFTIERTDGRTLRWLVDNAEIHTFRDPQPLAGAGHDHFGFNNWEVKVCFDNVKVTPLP